MSRLEEALEKANKLRESRPDTVRKKLPAVSERELKKVNNEFIVTLSDSDSVMAEEYRRLKSMVIRETKSDFLNTLMVTSSLDAEGKTLTAINLAVSLAQEMDHSILLVDADLRKPMIHKYLGVTYEYGLSDYLSGDIDVSDILIKTGIGNLVLLPAGHGASNPVELLSSAKMKALMNELKHRYMDRYIIIDTPPVLPFADTISIGSTVDGVIFVVQEGRAQRTSIEEALGILKNLNILGVVYNNVSKANLDGHYGSYYRYRYSYAKRGKKEK
jgi:protein-tyrosine kinase